MKITVAKLFDKASIPDQAVAQTLTGLVEHLNAGLRQVVEALTNAITLRDNIQCEVLTLFQTQSGVPVVVETKKKPVRIDLILPGKVLGLQGQTDGCRTLKWNSDSQDRLVVTPTYESGSTSLFDLTIFIIYN